MDSFEERLNKFNEGLAKLIKETDIEPIPTIFHGISATVANITLIDLKNENMLKKYGRQKIKKADEPTNNDNSPINPLAN